MNINGYSISMIRGDSESITVRCSDKEGLFIPFMEGDIIYFTVKKNYTDTESVIKKVITAFPDGNAVIEIRPEDTKHLQFNTIYYYDIQLTRSNGTITTIVPFSEFKLGVEVTDE